MPETPATPFPYLVVERRRLTPGWGTATVVVRQLAQTPQAVRATPVLVARSGGHGARSVGSTIGMGAAVVGGTLRCGPGRRRGLAVTLLLGLVAAGLTGSFVVRADRPAGTRGESQAGGAELPQAPSPAIEEMASPLPEATAAPPSSAQATGPADPVAPLVPPPAPTPAPAVAPRPASAAPVPVRSPAARPDLRPWIASSAPLDASPPIRVDVAAVGVTAPIGPLGLNRDGTLEVPSDFSRAGWYTGRPTPGETGPAIIVAHRASRRGPGAFWKLPDVQPGQEIVVTRADRRRVLFAVDRVEQHRKDAFPTESVYGPTPETALRLITCGGPFDPTLGDRYRDNVIVFAHMVGWAS